MANRHRSTLRVARALPQRIGARRVEQGVAHHRPDRARGHHRLRDQPVHRLEHRRLIDGTARRHCERRVEGERADEYGEAPQHDTLRIRE